MKINIFVPAAPEDTPEAAPAKLELRSVSRSLRSRTGNVNALANISPHVKRAEFVCIVGPSGCVKPTLLNLFAGLDQPTSGKVLLDGFLITEPSPDRVVMFQEHGLCPWLSVRKNIEFGLTRTLNGSCSFPIVCDLESLQAQPPGFSLRNHCFCKFWHRRGLNREVDDPKPVARDLVAALCRNLFSGLRAASRRHCMSENEAPPAEASSPASQHGYQA